MRNTRCCDNLSLRQKPFCELLPGLADRRRALAHILSVADHAIALVAGNVRYTGGVAELERKMDLGRLFVEGKG